MKSLTKLNLSERTSEIDYFPLSKMKYQFSLRGGVTDCFFFFFGAWLCRFFITGKKKTVRVCPCVSVRVSLIIKYHYQYVCVTVCVFVSRRVGAREKKKK